MYCSWDNIFKCCLESVLEQNGRLRTVLGTLAQLLHGLHAVNGQTIWVTFCAHFLLVDIDHVL